MVVLEHTDLFTYFNINSPFLNSFNPDRVVCNHILTSYIILAILPYDL